MSTTPPPKKTFRSRVGTVMRRSSMNWVPGLPKSNTPPPEDSAIIPRSSPPGIEREGSTASLKQLDTTPPPSTQLTTTTIPESPAREAAALAGETAPQGPSPLSGGVLTAEHISEPSLRAPEERRDTDETAVEPVPVIPSVVVNSPEPAAEAILAPTLTEEPEEMSPPPTREPVQKTPPDSTQTPVPASTPPPATAAAPAPPTARVPIPPAPAAVPTQAPAKTPPPAAETAKVPSITPQPSTSTSARAPTEASVPSRTPSPAPPAEISRVPSSAPPTPPGAYTD